MSVKGLGIGKIFIMNFIKQIKKNGSPEIVDDLKYIILTAEIDSDNNFKIIKTTAVNSKGQKEDVKPPAKKKKENNG